MKVLLSFLIMLCLSGCSQSLLQVRSQYYTQNDLASVHVDTPDPEKTAPIFGQRVYIDWSVPSKTFSSGPLELLIKIRLKNNEEKDLVIPLHNRSGTYYYAIVGEDYMKKGGLLSYLVELKSNGRVIATSHHKLWVNKIQIG